MQSPPFASVQLLPAIGKFSALNKCRTLLRKELSPVGDPLETAPLLAGVPEALHCARDQAAYERHRTALERLTAKNTDVRCVPVDD